MSDNQLREIVKKMVQAGESEENIAAVIKKYKSTTPKQDVKEVSYDEPSTFGRGFINSLLNGEALKAGLLGGKGFLEGAVDLPSGIASGVNAAINTISDPIGTIKNLPKTISDAASNMAQTTMMAGSDPEAFGKMTGQLTGQPLLTAGLTKGIPAGTFGIANDIPSGLSVAKPYIGSALERIGSVTREYQPISGLVPSALKMRTLRNLEGAIGGGIERLGQRINASKIPLIEGEIVKPKIAEGEFRDMTPQLKKSNTRYTANPERLIIGPGTEMEAGLPQGVMRPSVPSSGPFNLEETGLKIAPDQMVMPEGVPPPVREQTFYASGRKPIGWNEASSNVDKAIFKSQMDYRPEIRKKYPLMTTRPGNILEDTGYIWDPVNEVYTDAELYGTPSYNLFRR